MLFPAIQLRVVPRHMFMLPSHCCISLVCYVLSSEKKQKEDNPIKLRILTEGKKKMQCARNRNAALSSCFFFLVQLGVVGWCKGVMYLTSPGRPADIGLQLGKACYSCGT